MNHKSNMMNPLIKNLTESLFLLPSPSSISVFWNLGSILGMCLVSQLVTGLVLASSYNSALDLSFQSVISISQDCWFGWFIRGVHFNGVSVFFLALFLHVGRGIYFSSFLSTPVWITGSMLLILLMAVAFVGYVLPWGQMSLWGATVITNLLSAIPVWGDQMVVWVWGGYSVSGPTLSRFFMLHFLMPFILVGLVMSHLLSLHSKSSTDPIGVMSDLDKIPFHPYHSWKDGLGFWFVGVLTTMLVLEYPWALGETDNFIEANPMVTPVHIKPEWYFLFAYSVLRSIPNKLGGVIALLLSVLTVPLMVLKKGSKKNAGFSSIEKLLFWMWVASWMLLTWTGGCIVEHPFILISQVCGLSFFGLWLGLISMP